jgi:hypothetical protein
MATERDDSNDSAFVPLLAAPVTLLSAVADDSIAAPGPAGSEPVHSATTRRLTPAAAPPGLTTEDNSVSAAGEKPATPWTTAVRQQAAAVAGEIQRGIERFDWPSSAMLTLFLALAVAGYMLLLAVTEASPRSWKFQLLTPPN